MSKTTDERSGPPAVPFRIRVVVTAVTGLVSALLMSFLGLAINYGFRSDFLPRWVFAFVTGYVILVPVLLFILPIVQRVVVRYFAPFRQ